LQDETGEGGTVHVKQGRTTLHDERWSWTLEQMTEDLILTVVCGTVGLYERTVVLEPSEIDSWRKNGSAGLEPLVEAIRTDATGTRFAHRYLPNTNPSPT